MYNQPPPNLAQGISLAQAGRKPEALVYLRQAARTEPLNAEGWLWLAAASDDLEEYRLCVEQALRTDPRHPVAQRMQNDLMRLGEMNQTMPRGMPGIGTQTPPRSRGRRRFILLLLFLLLGAGAVVALIVSGVAEDALDRLSTRDEVVHSVEFTVGEGSLAHRFYVEVPSSWLPADTDSQTWIDTRGELEQAFPGSESVWTEIEASYSNTVRNPVYGELRPKPVAIVETDHDTLDDAGMVSTLALLEIQPLPKNDQDLNTCERLQLLQSELEAEPLPTGAEIVRSLIAQREGRDDCALVFHRRLTSAASGVLPGITPPAAVHEIRLAVPIEAENRYTLWILTISDSVYREADTDRLIASLDVVP